MIIAIDTETGGTNERTDALLSISACHYDEPENSFTVFIKPDPSLKIHPEATAVNGYTPALWEKRGAVPLREALSRFKAWLPYSGNAPLAHNAEFDKKFLNAAEEQTGFNLYLKRLWHCSMASFFYANLMFDLGAPNVQLVTLAKMAGHWPENYDRGDHQSLDDVLACAAGYKWLVSKGMDLQSEIERLLVENKALRSELEMKVQNQRELF